MRRLLAAAALTAAATVSVAPVPASAIVCVWVADICLPCGPVNDAYRELYGTDLLYC
ncbi:MAG TPA: hypothetical protein VNA20_04405 [Frankiaceae bacterium]|nr:hypothetical protein [Frankiaceae bacterium]